MHSAQLSPSLSLPPYEVLSCSKSPPSHKLFLANPCVHAQQEHGTSPTKQVSGSFPPTYSQAPSDHLQRHIEYCAPLSLTPFTNLQASLSAPVIAHKAWQIMAYHPRLIRRLPACYKHSGYILLPVSLSLFSLTRCESTRLLYAIILWFSR